MKFDSQMTASFPVDMDIPHDPMVRLKRAARLHQLEMPRPFPTKRLFERLERRKRKRPQLGRLYGPGGGDIIGEILVEICRATHTTALSAGGHEDWLTWRDGRRVVRARGAVPPLTAVRLAESLQIPVWQWHRASHICDAIVRSGGGWPQVIAAVRAEWGWR